MGCCSLAVYIVQKCVFIVRFPKDKFVSADLAMQVCENV